MVFEVGDQVWIHLRKERFPNERKSKLMPRIDGPFEVIRKISNNAYKLDLRGKYDVSNSFNITDLIPFIADEPDLRTNPFQVGGDDMIMDQLVDKDDMIMDQLVDKDEEGETEDTPAEEEDVLAIPTGPITRAMTRRLKEAVGNILKISKEQEDCLGRSLIHQDTLITIQVILPSS